MRTYEFFNAIRAATSVSDIETAITQFEAQNSPSIQWVPFGSRENNRGTIEAAADPGRSLVERLTNGIDAILEEEYERHNGRPSCRSPKEAATAWLNVPAGGLSDMSATQRRALAQRVTIKIEVGEGRSSRIVEVRDFGIGLSPDQMPRTILSLNESNKMQKYYLAGAYGQGGSSTLATSKYVLIASRRCSDPIVGFTVACYQDLPPDEYKIGRYAYLTLNGSVLTTEMALTEFSSGTLVKHFGYDLTNYPSPLGPNSIYGLLNQILFDPIMPVWLDDHEVHSYRRVIKGARNALNGAVDEGDEERRGPALSHRMRMFYPTLADFGQIGIEYWVLERPTTANKKPIAAFVNPAKPIILTLNGQNHAEMSHLVVRKDAELPYLTQRLICHVDCNHLTPAAKRALFVSNREDARRGIVYDLIHQEVLRALKSDDELVRLNNEAREQGLRERDETASQQVREEVARILRLQGIDIGIAVEAEVTGQGARRGQPVGPGHPRRRPEPLELHEPPTYIRIVWEEDETIDFYPEQRRYIRIETDANNTYHNPNNPAVSRINIIAPSTNLSYRGSTPLEGGRMRAVFQADPGATVGTTGIIRVELTRPGLPVLSDERPFVIVETPPARSTSRRITLPPFRFVQVNGPEDQRWAELGWPENIRAIASTAEMENGVLIIYYSTTFPKYAEQRTAFERRESLLANSFTNRYEVWLAVHSLLLYRDQHDTASAQSARHQTDEEVESAELREREERCRLATIAALVAAREIQGSREVGDTE